ncbi:hypothetical protein GRF29_44g122322 [Pseudopithomyces chartarum]|uniref:Uncharacterized protein n=1 Tax=Pseudopithomyces chartarum TaxID=1892770 RepID=A0AAN6RHK0_9PLEO|nr:hypothetical protein GRF29_44g122322 [Pseudopithomyces chartarum]
MTKPTEAEVINVLIEPTPRGVKPTALNAEAYIQHWCILTRADLPDFTNQVLGH